MPFFITNFESGKMMLIRSAEGFNEQGTGPRCSCVNGMGRWDAEVQTDVQRRGQRHPLSASLSGSGDGREG